MGRVYEESKARPHYVVLKIVNPGHVATAQLRYETSPREAKSRGAAAL